MKDNKDEEKTLFQAIDAVDDKFLMETLKDMEKRKNQNHKQQLKFKQMTPMVKAATIALICFLTLGISVSVAAATSKTFRQWIQKTFMSQTIYKVTQTKLCQSKQIFAFHPFDSKLHPAYSATHLNYIVL